jgi:hypothetical protein
MAWDTLDEWPLVAESGPRLTAANDPKRTSRKPETAHVANIRITVASPPDRERVVAEVFVGSEQLAEINQETGDGLSVDIYPRRDGTAWQLPYGDLIRALCDARERLIGKK